MVILYSTGCPQCLVLKKKLEQKSIEHNTISDVSQMRKLGLLSAPALKVDDRLMNFTEAIQWVNEYGR